MSVLALDGKFYYPARLIESYHGGAEWSVKWWRNNLPDIESGATHLAGSFGRIPISKIIDDLWKDMKGRRTVRVSSSSNLRHFTG